jgi:hypothetical protein
MLLSKNRVNEYLKLLAQYSMCKTPTEVRQQVKYSVVVWMIAALIQRGMTADLAAKAVSRITISLPTNFHVDFPDETKELIRLHSEELSVLYSTICEDFPDSLVEVIFLTFMDGVELRGTL